MLETLLARLIDDAAQFPPARMELPRALEQHRLVADASRGLRRLSKRPDDAPGERAQLTPASTRSDQL